MEGNFPRIVVHAEVFLSRISPELFDAGGQRAAALKSFSEI